MYYQVRSIFKSNETPDGFVLSERVTKSKSRALRFLRECEVDERFFACQFFVSVNEPKFYPGQN